MVKLSEFTYTEVMSDFENRNKHDKGPLWIKAILFQHCLHSNNKPCSSLDTDCPKRDTASISLRGQTEARLIEFVARRFLADLFYLGSTKIACLVNVTYET